MKLSTVALFAASAMTAVVPDADSYGEEVSAPEAPAYEAPAAPVSSAASPVAPVESSAPAYEAPAEETTAASSPEEEEEPSVVTDVEVVSTVTDCGPEVTNCAAEESPEEAVTTTVEYVFHNQIPLSLSPANA